MSSRPRASKSYHGISSSSASSYSSSDSDVSSKAKHGLSPGHRRGRPLHEVRAIGRDDLDRRHRLERNGSRRHQHLLRKRCAKMTGFK